MDRAIKKKTPWLKISILSGLGIILIVSIALSIGASESTYKVGSDKIKTATVVYGEFQDIINIQATVEPWQSMQIDAVEGGVVEEIFVENGSTVQKGDNLLRLSNASLQLDFMNRETQIVEQINNLRSTRISLDQNKRQVQEQLVELDYNLSEQLRQWKIDSSLWHDSVISEMEFLASAANLKYLNDRKTLMSERLSTDEAYRQSQLQNIDESMRMMQRNLNAVKKNLENLVVKAPITGQLNSFDHQIGETKARGERLGRVDVIDGYLLSAQVDQYYLNRLQLGQQADYELNGKTFELELSKILPTVTNNQFEVHLEFLNELPSGLRRGQNVQIRLKLSAKSQSLLVQRGAFFQSSGGSFVYVLEDGDRAVKRPVRMGSQNPEYIQVLDGLNEGELIITSSYDAFGEADVIRID